MKKIISGKLYSTDTAECVAKWDNGKYTSDVWYVSVDLYRTKTGNWFVHKVYGHGDNGIAVLTAEEVLAWVEEHDLSEEETGKISEVLNVEEASEEITRLTLRLPEETYGRIWKIHTETRKSINSIIIDLINNGLE